MLDKEINFNKLAIHPSFKDTVSEINKLNIQLPPTPTSEEMDFTLYPYPQEGKLVSNIEEIRNYKFDLRKGEKLTHGGVVITAYDESFRKYSALEGSAFLTSHSLIVLHESDYLPLCYLTFYFYTRSKQFTEESNHLKYSQYADRANTVNYVKDRYSFILKNIPNNSILFIDGPLLGGQVSSYTIKLNEELLKKNVCPIFFIKNSSSNLVINNIKELRGKYNSDMHWSHNTLNSGERTNLFKYEDIYNKENAKIFCYIKPFNIGPQRIEFHVNTFKKFKGKIMDILDIIYYLLIVQGNLENPQIRPIAIAEKYARETLNLINLRSLMKNIGLMPTMNQERFRM